MCRRRSVGAAAEAQTLFLRDSTQHKNLSKAPPCALIFSEGELY